MLSLADKLQDSRDPVIEEKDLRRLLHTLDASLNVTTTAHMIMRDLKIKPGKTISCNINNPFIFSF